MSAFFQLCCMCAMICATNAQVPSHIPSLEQMQYIIEALKGKTYSPIQFKKTNPKFSPGKTWEGSDKFKTSENNPPTLPGITGYSCINQMGADATASESQPGVERFEGKTFQPSKFSDIPTSASLSQDNSQGNAQSTLQQNLQVSNFQGFPPEYSYQSPQVQNSPVSQSESSDLNQETSPSSRKTIPYSPVSYPTVSNYSPFTDPKNAHLSLPGLKPQDFSNAAMSAFNTRTLPTELDASFLKHSGLKRMEEASPFEGITSNIDSSFKPGLTEQFSFLNTPGFNKKQISEQLQQKFNAAQQHHRNVHHGNSNAIPSSYLFS